jgi:hypothetical protein
LEKKEQTLKFNLDAHYGGFHLHVTMPVRSERSRASGEVEERAVERPSTSLRYAQAERNSFAR